MQPLFLFLVQIFCQFCNFAWSQCQAQWRNTQVSFIHPLDTMHRPQNVCFRHTKTVTLNYCKICFYKREEIKRPLYMFSGFQHWQSDKKNLLKFAHHPETENSPLVFVKQADHLLFLSDVFALELSGSVCCKEYNNNNENFHFCHSRWKRGNADNVRKRFIHTSDNTHL